MCASQGWGRKEARVKFVVVEGLLAIRAPSRQPYSDPRAHRPWRPPTRTCRQRRVCKCVRRARSGEAQGAVFPGIEVVSGPLLKRANHRPFQARQIAVADHYSGACQRKGERDPDPSRPATRIFSRIHSYGLAPANGGRTSALCCALRRRTPIPSGYQVVES